MDLRRRLVLWLGGLLAGLMLVAVLISQHSLRADIQAEVAASEQLVAVLLKAGQTPTASTDELAALLANARLRHLSIRLDDDQPHSDPAPHWLAPLLGVTRAVAPEQTIRLGEQTLHIAANPTSEIEERLGDTVRLCITLLLYSGATLLVAWWSADRALTPVRELEAGLQRLADKAPDAAMPPFALREFRRVARAIDALGKALAASRAAQQQLSRQLISLQEEERHALARELHDEMGQTLTAIGVTAAFLERNATRLEPPSIIDCARDLRRDVKTSGEQLRAMLKRLRPYGLDALGLASALRELVASWQQRESGIAFELDMPAHLPELDDAAALVLYRVLQEALTNVVRHSDAQHCRIRVQGAPDSLRVSVEDDGKGLPEAGPARRGGLLGMEERLEMAGGKLAIDGKESKGLRLHASLPLKRKEEEEQ